MENDITKLLKIHLPEMKEKFKIKEIGLFGSYVKGMAKRRSDIDILIEFEEGMETFDNYMELKFYLEKLFNRKVNLVIKSSLKERLKPYILSEVIYV